MLENINIIIFVFMYKFIKLQFWGLIYRKRSKMIKKIISIALSCTMLFSTISCNKKQDIKDEKFNMSKIENYFRTYEIIT